MKFLPLVWRNLMRRKIRTFMTVMSIVVAFVLFAALMAIRAAFSMGVDVAGADRLMMIHKVSIIQSLPRSYEERIRATEGVTLVTHANWFGGYYQEPANFVQSMAVDPETWLQMYPEFELPADQKKAWLADRTGAVIGADLAKKYGWKIGDRVPLLAPIYQRAHEGAWEFTIDGIYDSNKQGVDKTQFFFQFEYLNETMRKIPGLADQIGWYVFRVADPSTSDQLAKRIDAMFANSPTETKTATEKAFISDWAKQVGDIGSIMIAITGVVMFFILFVAGNAMAQSVRERINELGVLKTLGFGDGRILALVLLESCTIAFLGGGLGLLIGWTIITVGGDPTGGMLPIFHFPPRDLVLGAILVLAARNRHRHAAGVSGEPAEDRRCAAENLVWRLPAFLSGLLYELVVSDYRGHRRDPSLDPAPARIVHRGDRRYRRRRHRLHGGSVDCRWFSGSHEGHRRCADGDRAPFGQRHRDDERFQRRGSAADLGSARRSKQDLTARTPHPSSLSSSAIR